MIPGEIAITAFVLVLLTLVGYLLAARQGRRRTIEHPDDFFLARQRMTSDDLGDTQIAYALQMSTVYPFFVLAMTGIWIVPAVNSMFWLVGIALFYAGVRHFTPLLGQTKTLHAYVADVNAAPELRRVASPMTILAFSGVIVFEVVYGAIAFKVILGDNEIVYYSVIALLAAYLTTYIWNGGQTATLRTEQFQLLVAYIGLHSSITQILSSDGFRSEDIVPPLIPILVFVGSIIMLYTRGSMLFRALRAKRRFLSVAYILMLLSLLGVVVSLAVTVPHLKLDTLLGNRPLLPAASTLEAVMMIGTAVLIPVFWQFVDLTNWQRIAALSTGESKDYATEAKKSFLHYLVESPLSWFLVVLLGIAAALTMSSSPSSGDLFEAFVRHMLTQPGWSQIAGIFLIAGIVGVFMSTADAAITVVGYAFAYDFWKPTRALIDRESLSASETVQVVQAGKRAMVVVVAFVVSAFVLIDWAMKQGGTFIGLLFAFYTPVVALAPAVICPTIFRRRPSRVFASAAIVVGAASGLLIGLYSAVGHPELQWYPAPVAFVVSWGLYLGGFVFSRERVQDYGDWGKV